MTATHIAQIQVYNRGKLSSPGDHVIYEGAICWQYEPLDPTPEVIG